MLSWTCIPWNLCLFRDAGEDPRARCNSPDPRDALARLDLGDAARSFSAGAVLFAVSSCVVLRLFPALLRRYIVCFGLALKVWSKRTFTCYRVGSLLTLASPGSHVLARCLLLAL